MFKSFSTEHCQKRTFAWHFFLNIVDQFKYVLNKFEEVKFTNVFMGSNAILYSNNKSYLEQMVILTIILNANISAFIVCFSIFFFSLVHKSIFMVLESTKHSVWSENQIFWESFQESWHLVETESRKISHE